MRKTAIQVALVVAGLGLLFAPALFGSNMGFKLERNLNQVAGSQSFYIMSFPFYRSFNDLWNTGGGVLGTDGAVQSDDVLADWFTNGDGACDGGWECVGGITLMYFDNTCPGATCNQFVFQTIAPDPFTSAPAITGVPFQVLDTAGADPTQGFLAQIIDSGAFPVIIVGSENPDVVQVRVDRVTGSQSFFPFSMLYHTTWTTSADVLQAAWDGQDDLAECPLIFTIMDFDNNCPASPTCNQFVFQSIAEDPFTNCLASTTGTPFNLVPGNGYMFQLSASGSDIALPHY